MKINFEDDVVKVEEESTGRLVYKGLEDYDPMKRENWRYVKSKGHYRFVEEGKVYIKTKLG